MADYFTNFSLIVPLPSKFAQGYATELAAQAERTRMGDETPADFPAPLADVLEDWCFDTDTESGTGKFGLWLHSSNGGVDAVCAFIQHLLAKFDPDECVSFEWSHDCSKPRTDAFGGGAAIITARKTKIITTSEWLQKQLARHHSNQPAQAFACAQTTKGEHHGRIA